MIRTFKTHEIRKQSELEGLWSFYPKAEAYSGKEYKLNVPGCWEEHPDLINYRGKGIYRQRIEAEGNIRLVFKGVSHTARVFFDGEFQASHYNAYTPFDVVIQDVEAGIHEIEVEVDNSFNEDSSLHIPNDYQTYGGINRPVVVEVVPDAYIKYLHFTPFRQDNIWHAKIDVAVENIGQISKEVDIKVILDNEEYSFGTEKIPPNKLIKLTQIRQWYMILILLRIWGVMP